MGIPETTPVYPVSTVTMASAPPPPYTVGVGAAPVAVEMQPAQQFVVQPAYIGQGTHVVQPQVVQTSTVIVTVNVKRVPHDTCYSEYCPRCQANVTTRTEYTIGACWWIILCIGVFVACWPILYCLCCTGSKDVKHFCPNCGALLAEKKRAC